MVQVIQAAQRKPSFSQRLGVAVGRGVEGSNQLYQQHQQNEEQQQQQNKN